MNKLTLIIFLCLSSNFVMADIIDLGSIEIEGEVRRPLIQYTSTSFSLKKELRNQIHSRSLNFKQSLDAKFNATKISSHNGLGHLSLPAVKHEEFKTLEMGF